MARSAAERKPARGSGQDLPGAREDRPGSQVPNPRSAGPATGGPASRRAGASGVCSRGERLRMARSPPTFTALGAASILGYVWAALMLLVSVAVAIPAAAAGGARGAAPMAIPALLSVASAAGAYGVRRARRPHLALGASVGWIAFLVLVPLTLSFAGIALNTVILGLVLTNLRRFR